MQAPVHAQYVFDRFTTRVFAELGIDITASAIEVENGAIRFFCRCERLIWADAQGAFWPHSQHPPEFIQALETILQNDAQLRKMNAKVAEAQGQITLELLIDGKQEFDRAVEKLGQYNAAAWKQLALAAGAGAFAEPGIERDNRRLRQPAKVLEAEVAAGRKDYTKASQALIEDVDANLADAKNRNQFTRQIIQEKMKKADIPLKAWVIVKGLDGKEVANLPKTVFEEIVKETRALSYAGTFGKAANLGITGLQLYLAVIDPEEADKIHMEAVQNLKILLLGALLSAAAIGLARVVIMFINRDFEVTNWFGLYGRPIWRTKPRKNPVRGLSYPLSIRYGILRLKMKIPSTCIFWAAGG